MTIPFGRLDREDLIFSQEVAVPGFEELLNPCIDPADPNFCSPRQAIHLSLKLLCRFAQELTLCLSWNRLRLESILGTECSGSKTIANSVFRVILASGPGDANLTLL